MNREPPGAERSSLENRLGSRPQGFESLSLRHSPEFFGAFLDKTSVREGQTMGRGTRYLESSATEKEDSYRYRVEWDDYITADYDRSEGRIKVEHHGGGSRDVSGFDNAWDVFNDYRNHPDYKGVRLIQIDSDGLESVSARK